MTVEEAQLYPLARKLAARALVLRYLRERDEKAGKAVLNASADTWERKCKVMHKARAAYVEAQTGLGWVPYFDKAAAALGGID